MSRVLMVTALSLVTGACGGWRTASQQRGDALEQENVELRAKARHERRARQDLERELLRSKQQKVSAQPPPALPVEVLSPDGEADAGTEPAQELDGEVYAVVGVDDAGQEIVYVGEAARPTSDKVIVLNSQTHPEISQRGGEAAPAAARPMPTVRTPSLAASRELGADDLPLIVDRIEVTREIPTVARQLERARARKPAPTPAPPRSTDRAAEDYRRGYDLLKAGDHVGALAAFQEFVEKYPSHDFADNAQYWLGETHYDRRAFDRAAAAFQVVLDRYPKGNKVPDAMLKLGYCRHSTGDRGGAVRMLQDLVNRYPKTGPAKLARERLDALAKETP